MWKSQKIRERIKISEIFSLFEGKYERNYNFNGESHNFWECVYVQEGMICVSADERVYTLGKNSIVFHKPMEFHKFYTDSNEGAKLLIFSFSCEGELCEYLCNKVFSLSESQQNIISSMLMYCRENNTKRTVELHECPDDTINYLRTSKIDLQMLSTYICQLFLLLADGTAASAGNTSPEAEIFGKAVDYMQSNADRQLSVSDISKFCGVSESGLKRIFAKFAGVGIHKYFIQIKIKVAIKLIESGVSISETADRLSFSSQGYFSAMFKRETGKSPSEFLKMS